MALIARRSFKYGSRSYSPGDAVPVRPSDRRALTALNFVAEGTPTLSTREAFMRSHLQYQYDAPDEPVAETPEAAPEETPEEVKPKRKYVRRDMQASD